jgi:hypothetical protein
VTGWDRRYPPCCRIGGATLCNLPCCWLGLALATALWSGVQAINAEARSSYAEAAATLGQDRLGRLVGRDGGPVAIGDYVALRRAGYRVSPVITGRSGTLMGG